jgi:hypothetical protein
MAFWSRARTAEPPPRPEIGLQEILDDYNIVDVDEDKRYMVVAPKQQLIDPTVGEKFEAVSNLQTTELGSAVTAYGRTGQDDYNPELRSWLGLRKWDEMRRGDGTVRSALRLVKTPIYAARWFVEPASTSTTDRRVADFVEGCLFRDMSVSWPQLLTEITLHLDFGSYLFEKVFTFKNGKIVWQKWSPRHPMSVVQWEYDSHGGPLGAWTYGNNELGKVFIPISKLLVFTNEKEGGNIEGISILRSAYKHWFYADNLMKIDAIQKERHGIGVPVIKLPPNYSEKDKEVAGKMGENLRTNEKAHIVLPPLWEIATLKIEGQPVNALDSAKFHTEKILDSVLANFIGATGGGTSTEVKADLFNKSTRFVAEQIRDVINKWAIPELVNYNWKTVDQYPELRVRRIGETVDWQKISFALRNMVGAGIIIPDDQLETWIRDELDLPAADPATKRQVATPQLPGGGGAADAAGGKGAPRQSQAKNSTQGTTPGAKTGQASPNNQG